MKPKDGQVVLMKQRVN